jgi:hypothetical protein
MVDCLLTTRFMREGGHPTASVPSVVGGECGAHFLPMLLSKVHVERGSGNVERELKP